MLCQPEVDEHEVSSGVVETLSETGDREGLAGSPAHENVNCAWLNVPLLVLGHVPVVLDVGEAVREDRRRKRLNLAETYRRPSKVMPRDRGGFDTRTYREIAHAQYLMGMTTA